MTNTFGAAWEVPNQPAYPISLEVTSGSQTVSHGSQLCVYTQVLSCVIGDGVTPACLPFEVTSGSQTVCELDLLSVISA